MKIRSNDVKRFLQFARKFWGSHFRDQSSTVVLSFNASNYTISMQRQGLVLSYLCNRVDSVSDHETIAVPLDLLRDCVNSSETITLRILNQDGGEFIQASWQDGPVPRMNEYEQEAMPNEDLIPDLAWHTIDERFLTALARTAEVADDNSVRYGLSCIELDGRHGSVTATDGNQLLRYDGFSFPWQSEALLIRKNKVMQCKDWLSGRKVELARQEYDLFIRFDAYTLRIPLERGTRFPNVDQVIPDRQRSTNRVLLDTRDCDALTNCLLKLPGESEDLKPVILDLNGHVAVVGKSGQGTTCTVCLELDRSLHLGPDRRIGIPRKNLSFAAKIGADSLFLFGKDQAILACGQRMQYVWMPLSNLDLTLDLTQTQCIKTSMVAFSSDRRRAS